MGIKFIIIIIHMGAVKIVSQNQKGRGPKNIENL